MHKVYLLLRNNIETGPHSLEEILQLNLKPTDLIWVEGKSSGWSYPSEIEELGPYFAGANAIEAKKTDTYSNPIQQAHQAYLPADEKNSDPVTSPDAKKVFVSLPGNMAKQSVSSQSSPTQSLEQKAEELRKKVQAYSAEKKPAQNDATVQAKYTRTLNDVEEDYTSWMYKQKTKKKITLNERSVAIGVIVVIVAAIGYTFIKPSNKTQQVTNEVAVQHPATQDNLQTNEIPQQVVQPQNIASVNVVPQQSVNHNPSTSTAKKSNHEALQTPVKKASPILKTVDNANSPATQQTDNNQVQTQNKTDKEIAAATPQKKKTFTEKLDDFFDKLKRKKSDASPAEEPQTTTPNNPSTSERKATHRGEESTTTETTNLADKIEVTSNESSEDWMMGVHGLKITVRNRNTETVNRAVVEVHYYNEQKDLLDKKTITFTNIPPKQSLTLPAPDHRMADHTDYKLLSAN